ncbi:hypothetical protein CF66_3042 [Candidatus Photodesmus katoptron]|uniref:Uncharacterized protein n=1 Tax=Candidatus Photodesmus katoptron Akat1 TaxID=1236703 RepID=S3DIE5_9GAMM|nr:hypothetical protein [Candidatus Photodesmus katoptron]EPE37490.1 hypothetical protein O1U_0794 [Candidatus Photodesmus katoptron Akat1]KEY90319.1 hypothetical protein CF66_3042 [Candidatus Photodesmus katoptron]
MPTYNSSRRWNNILILGVTFFITVLSLPNIVKTYLNENKTVSHAKLLNPNLELKSLHFQHWSLDKIHGNWIINQNKTGHVKAEQLAERWQSIIGTKINQQTYNAIISSLDNPKIIKAYYFNSRNPQTIIFYQKKNSAC